MTEKRTILAIAVSGLLVAAFTFLGPKLFGREERAPAARTAAPAREARRTPESKRTERPRVVREKAVRPRKRSDGERPREERARLVTSEFEADLTTRGAAVRSLLLRNPHYRIGEGDSERPIDLVTTEREKWLPMRIAFREGSFDYPRLQADYEILETTEESVTFGYLGEDVEIRKRFSVGLPHEMWLTTTVRSLADRTTSHRFEVHTWAYVRLADEKGGMFRQSPWVGGAVCNHGGEVEHFDRGDIWHEVGKAGRVLFTGLENIYFLTAMGPSGQAQADCRLDADSKPNSADPQGTLYRASLGYPSKRLAPGEAALYRTRLFFGPKERDLMQRVGMGLQNAIDYSTPILPDVIAFPLCRTLLWTLKWLHGIAGNWGIAIILLTLVVKLLLFPLTAKSFRSMREMQKVKPLIDEINKKYADDKERKNQAMMQLYKTHKINPFGGCLPILLQTPIWIALYTMLWRGVELYRSPFFLWYADLSAPDPYFVLPILLGVTMFVQQKITPTTLDATQQKMMLYFMPIMFTFFMLFLPAGLCLYSFVNALLTIGQQRLLYRGQPSPVAAAQPVPQEVATVDDRRQSRRARRRKR